MGTRALAVSVLLIGCTHSAGTPPSHIAPASDATAWIADPCFVSDTTARSADTLFLIETGETSGGAPATSSGCSAAHVPSTPRQPVVVTGSIRRELNLLELAEAPVVPGGMRLDVIITRDTKFLAWAAKSPRYLMAPLPWSVTYVFVPARVTNARAIPTPAERDSLARQAVSVDARGAAEPFPWISDSACAVAAVAPAAAPPSIIAYPSDDATARQLAERIVSLAGAKSPAAWVSSAFGDHASGVRLRISAMHHDAIADALAHGRIAGAVIPVERDPRAVCFTSSSFRVPAGAIPLVDVRDYAVVRRGSGAAFVVDPNGSLYFYKRGAP